MYNQIQISERTVSLRKLEISNKKMIPNTPFFGNATSERTATTGYNTQATVLRRIAFFWAIFDRLGLANSHEVNTTNPNPSFFNHNGNNYRMSLEAGEQCAEQGAIAFDSFTGSILNGTVCGNGTIPESVPSVFEKVFTLDLQGTIIEFARGVNETVHGTFETCAEKYGQEVMLQKDTQCPTDDDGHSKAILAIVITLLLTYLLLVCTGILCRSNGRSDEWEESSERNPFSPTRSV